ncbi:14775_t:CDS:2 [Acaulospora morrowiae]|uniref:ferroxidase n=1 Tax=Acaulospora morrowiae TaxID=94023 RepID=A0A9N9HY36_9GLOM|nr:14775_t:CDS:2 [Acaulospora morrowiae]
MLPRLFPFLKVNFHELILLPRFGSRFVNARAKYLPIIQGVGASFNFRSRYQGAEFQPFRLYTSVGEPTQNAQYNSELSDSTYHQLSETTMEHLLEYFENLGDTLDNEDYDVEYSYFFNMISDYINDNQAGVLTLKCGVSGTYVINKQPPNKQIWLSSPISGPKRYDYDPQKKRWVYNRDSTTLDEILNEELSLILNVKVDVPIA